MSKDKSNMYVVIKICYYKGKFIKWIISIKWIVSTADFPLISHSVNHY